MVHFTVAFFGVVALLLLLTSTGTANYIDRRATNEKPTGHTPERTHGKNEENVQGNTHAKNPETKDRSSHRKTARAVVTGASGILGKFQFTEIQGGSATLVEIDVTGLPVGAEYPYHIHEHEVENNDCATALGHFNPTNVTSKACDFYAPGHCESGDFSGKFGKLPSGNSRRRYYDASFKLGKSSNSIIGRSIVIHNPDLKRLACGNIVGGEVSQHGAKVDDPAVRC